jgi:methylglutaconyl-CoA hydratase
MELARPGVRSGLCIHGRSTFGHDRRAAERRGMTILEGEDRSMTENAVLSEVDARGVATVVLNRPEVRNAYDERLINQLGEAFQALRDDRRVRLVVLRGNGQHFQAGADLNCLKRLSTAPVEQNVEFSCRTTEVLRQLNALPKQTVALVQGACYGGGVGMVACCDVAIASESARFALSEVRWGVIPAPIIPQLCAAMGVRSLRRYASTGERFDAHKAHRIGLIHEVCADGALDTAAVAVIDGLLRSAPDAVAETKLLVLERAGLDISAAEVRALAVQGALKRAPRPKPGKASRALSRSASHPGTPRASSHCHEGCHPGGRRQAVGGDTISAVSRSPR